MILVDTNVWREASHPQGDAGVRQWLLQEERSLRLSTIVLSEIRFGLALMDPGRRKSALEIWCDRLEAEYSERTLGYDAGCARTFGSLAALTRQRGLNIGVLDLQIGAQAMAHDATLATRNTRHFEPMGLKLIDPWAA